MVWVHSCQKRHRFNVALGSKVYQKLFGGKTAGVTQATLAFWNFTNGISLTDTCRWLSNQGSKSDSNFPLPPIPAPAISPHVPFPATPPRFYKHKFNFPPKYVTPLLRLPAGNRGENLPKVLQSCDGHNERRCCDEAERYSVRMPARESHRRHRGRRNIF